MRMLYVVLVALYLFVVFLSCVALGSAAKEPVPSWDSQADDSYTHFWLLGVTTATNCDESLYLAFDASI